MGWLRGGGRPGRGGHFRDKVVVVTGASSGVGRAIARAFGAAGAKVGLVARNREALERAAAEIRAAGGQALVLPLDVESAAAVQGAADRVVSAWGSLDVWVNDAMVTVFARAADVTPDEYRRVTAVDYLGAVHGTLAALGHMRRQGRGVIVQIGSALAYRSIPLQAAYCASKAALRAFTDSLRCELLHDGSRVRLTTLHLPAVNTPQFERGRNKMPRHPQPVPPIYEPELVARVALYAARHPRREFWIAPSTVKAIVGQRVVPGLLDRYLARFAWDGQMTDRAPPNPRAGNLMQTLPGDPGAHGIFDEEARAGSAQVWARTHPRAALALLAGAGASVAAVVVGRGARRA